MDTTRGYHLCFSRVFELLSKRVEKRIEWQHIDGGASGFHAVTMDMDSKQMTGRSSNLFLGSS